MIGVLLITIGGTSAVLGALLALFSGWSGDLNSLTINPEEQVKDLRVAAFMFFPGVALAVAGLLMNTGVLTP